MITDYGKKGEDWGKPYQRKGFYGWKKFVAGAHIMAFKHKKKQWEYCFLHQENTMRQNHQQSDT